MSKWITRSLLEILTETTDRTVRKTVLDILGGEGAVPWQDLEPLLGDPRWYVVRNAVQLAAGIGHEELTDHAPRLLAHHDVRVRRETVRALGRLGGRAAFSAFSQALSDTDPSVRILAANAVGRKGGPEQRRSSSPVSKIAAFYSLSGEEMEAFLGAYAELAQEKAIPLLVRSWRKSLLSARPMAFRVAAVLALGRVRAPAAHAALQAAATVLPNLRSVAPPRMLSIASPPPRLVMLMSDAAPPAAVPRGRPGIGARPGGRHQNGRLLRRRQRGDAGGHAPRWPLKSSSASTRKAW